MTKAILPMSLPMRLVILALPLLATGCAFFGKPSEEELRQIAEVRVVTPVDVAGAVAASSGDVRPAATRDLGPLYAPLLAANFEASHSSSITEQGGGGVQKIAMARAEARRGALRALAAKIIASTPQGPDGPSMGRILGENAGWAARLSDGLDQKAAVEMNESATQVRATAAISGEIIAGLLGIAGLRRTQAVADEDKSGAAGSPLANARAEAQSQALGTARLRLYELLTLEGATGRALQNGIRRNPQLELGLRGMIEKLQPSNVVFTDDSKCELTLGVERRRAYDMINRYN